MVYLTIARKQNILYLAYLVLTSLGMILLYHQTQSQWVYYREAEKHYLLKNYDDAILFYQKSLAEGDTNEYAKLHLADSYVAVGDFPKAIELYKRHLESYPEAKEVHYALAKALFWNGNLEESESEYKKVVNSK